MYTQIPHDEYIHYLLQIHTNKEVKKKECCVIKTHTANSEIPSAFPNYLDISGVGFSTKNCEHSTCNMYLTTHMPPYTVCVMITNSKGEVVYEE